MELADERLEEIHALEKQLKIANDSLEVSEAHTRLQDNQISDMKEKIDADFQVIMVLNEKKKSAESFKELAIFQNNKFKEVIGDIKKSLVDYYDDVDNKTFMEFVADVKTALSKLDA